MKLKSVNKLLLEFEIEDEIWKSLIFNSELNKIFSVMPISHSGGQFFNSRDGKCPFVSEGYEVCDEESKIIADILMNESNDSNFVLYSQRDLFMDLADWINDSEGFSIN